MQIASFTRETAFDATFTSKTMWYAVSSVIGVMLGNYSAFAKHEQACEGSEDAKQVLGQNSLGPVKSYPFFSTAAYCTQFCQISYILCAFHRLLLKYMTWCIPSAGSGNSILVNGRKVLAARDATTSQKRELEMFRILQRIIWKCPFVSTSRPPLIVLDLAYLIKTQTISFK